MPRRSLTRWMVAASLALAIAIVLSAQPGYPQQPAPPRDSTPFERPKPLVTLTSNNPRQTLTDLRTLVERHHFQVSNLDVDGGEFLATRPDNAEPGSSDRILVSLDPVLAQPTSRLRVFFSYARFEAFFGTAEPVRIRATAPEEQSRIGTLKNEVVQYGIDHH